MVITSRQKHQREPLRLQLKVGDHTIDQVNDHKVLGVLIDDKLTWEPHINHVCKNVARNLFLLSKLGHFVGLEARKCFFYAHCLSHINYASPVWSGASDNHIKKLNSLYRRGANILSRNLDIPTDLKLQQLQLLPLLQQFNFNTAVLVHKVRHNEAPTYLRDFLVQATSRYGSLNYLLPYTRIDMFKASFAFSGAAIWNSLPLNVKSVKSLPAFKKALRKHLFLRKA